MRPKPPIRVTLSCVKSFNPHLHHQFRPGSYNLIVEGSAGLTQCALYQEKKSLLVNGTKFIFGEKTAKNRDIQGLTRPNVSVKFAQSALTPGNCRLLRKVQMTGTQWPMVSRRSFMARLDQIDDHEPNQRHAREMPFVEEMRCAGVLEIVRNCYMISECSAQKREPWSGPVSCDQEPILWPNARTMPQGASGNGEVWKRSETATRE